MLNQGYGF